MKRRLLSTLLLLALSGLLGSCMLDYNEAIPCENDGHCPEGYTCNLVDHRCVSGSAASDDDAGETEDPSTEPIEDATDETTDDTETAS